ncbi:hypothetical protein L7F22_002414, partial [Adiantum nelumboides]|nr:hypothetical protein [Adiantum nelumboides]
MILQEKSILKGAHCEQGLCDAGNARLSRRAPSLCCYGGIVDQARGQIIQGGICKVSNVADVVRQQQGPFDEIVLGSEVRFVLSRARQCGVQSAPKLEPGVGQHEEREMRWWVEGDSSARSLVEPGAVAWQSGRARSHDRWELGKEARDSITIDGKKGKEEDKVRGMGQRARRVGREKE